MNFSNDMYQKAISAEQGSLKEIDRLVPQCKYQELASYSQQPCEEEHVCQSVHARPSPVYYLQLSDGKI